MTSTQDRLTDAMSAAASTVRDEELRPLVTPRRRRQRAAGRRWPRPAWAAPVAAAAAVTLVIGLAVSLRLFGTQRPAGPARQPDAPRQFNPLIPNVSFGWLPAGESLGQGGVRRTEAFLSGGPPPGLLGWGLSVYARGRCHLMGSARVLKCTTEGVSGVSTWRLSERAPAVDGHSAFWADSSLVWQYARGGWAALGWPGSAPGVRTPRHETVMRHREAIKIADHIRFGATRPPLAFPARFTGLTGRWRVSDVHYWAGSGLLQTDEYVLTTRASRFFPHVGDLGVWANAAYVMIHPAPRSGTCTPHDPASKNTSEIINGYHVVVKRLTIGGLPVQEVCAAHADGLWVDIQEFGPHPTIGVTSLFKHLQLLGANPANWTSNPLG